MLTRGGAIQRLLADDEGLNICIPACWACNFLDGNEVVGQAWFKKLEEFASAVYAFWERLEDFFVDFILQ